jgi:hypothetical protein
VRRPDRTWDMASAGLLLAVAVVMGSTVLDYGITADEGVQQRYGRRLVRWYTTLGHDRSATERNNLYLYGGAFELAAQAAEKVSPLGVYESRHLANAAVGFAGIVAAWGLGRCLAGSAAGFGAALFLSLTPGYYGHAFANPKDIPFATLYAAAAWSILSASKARLRPASGRVVLAGALVGLAAGVRVNGMVLVPFAAILWAATGWAEGRRLASSRGEAVRLGLSLLVVLIVAWTVMLGCWPWAQLSPLANPVRGLRAFSDFQGIAVFFDGELFASTHLPRSYVPKLLALTLPEFYFVAFALGTFALLAGVAAPGLVRGPTERRVSAVRVAWLALLALFPLGWAIAARTPLYNGLRHLLFVVPILSVLASLAVLAAARRLPARAVFPGLGLLAAALLVASIDMVRLHPYQYVYFNRLFAGGLASAVNRYETDYWLASYKEGVSFVCDHYSRSPLHGPVRIGGNRHVPFAAYLGAGSCAAQFFTAVAPEQAPHVLLVTPTERGDVGPAARLLHVVERANAPLLYVFELRRPGPAP